VCEKKAKGDRYIMNGKDLKVGDTVYYFDGRFQPEKAIVTKILNTQFEGFDCVAISKKDEVTGEDLVVCDFYLYKTVGDVKNAIRWHVCMLRNWKFDDEKDPLTGEYDETE
jgi:hypothetical protein